jgi:hypothetical protein
MTLRHSLALEMAAFLAWKSAPARPAMLGVVVEANRVHLNSGTVSEGATVYDGDQFSTEAGGMLRLRGDSTMIDLAEESVLMVRSRANGVQGTEAELSQGTVVFRAARAAALEIAALEARVRPVMDGRTIAQVSVTGPKELCIYVWRGPLQFSYRGETETIAEGAAYRVILDPPEDDPKKKEAPKASRKRKAFLFVAIGGGAAAAAVILYENHGHRRMESPDRP